MAKILTNGTTIILVDNSTGTAVNLGTAIDTITSPVGKQVAELDVTSFADTAERFIAGIEQSSEIRLEGPYDDANNLAAADRHYSTLVGTIQTVEFAPAGTASGKRKISGEFLCRSYQVVMAGKSAVRWVAVHKLDGSMTLGTY